MTPDAAPASTQERLRTPRAAALAEIPFALLYAGVLIRVAVPADPADRGAWLRERAGGVALARRRTKA